MPLQTAKVRAFESHARSFVDAIFGRGLYMLTYDNVMYRNLGVDASSNWLGFVPVAHELTGALGPSAPARDELRDRAHAVAAASNICHQGCRTRSSCCVSCVIRQPCPNLWTGIFTWIFVDSIEWLIDCELLKFVGSDR